MLFSSIRHSTLCILILTIWNCDCAQLPTVIDGQFDEHFKPLVDTFRKNFDDGWERDGAAFTVFHKGKKVVDIWGGYMDKASARLWQKETLNTAYSTTKAMAALCVALLVDQGILKYSTRVAEFWPEFAQNEKENITVEWILSHRAGLAWTDGVLDQETAADFDKTARLFEKQRPQWPPGTQLGYHTLTYMWLVDQIVTRTDSKHRRLNKFYDEEFAQKYEVDFYIGLPVAKAYRVARLRTPSLWNFIDEYFTNPKMLSLWKLIVDITTSGPIVKCVKNAPWLDFTTGDPNPWNNADLYPFESGAMGGFGTPRAMAELFEKIRTGKVFSETTMKLLRTPVVTATDVVTGAYATRGQGFLFTNVTHSGKTHVVVGHSGVGGQNVRIDFENELTFAYMSNGLKVGLGDTARTYLRLLDTLYSVIAQPSSEKNNKSEL